MKQDKPGFFARKYGDGENLLTIFKSPKIWGALLGELLGTMLMTLLIMSTLGFFRVDYVPIFVMCAVLGLYIIIVKISGAHLNPLITAGMMASRRMSAIRGILYILVQFIGAWLGYLILNAFRLGGATEYSSEFPALVQATLDNFWALALVSLMSAIVMAFVYARALRGAKKSPLTFAFAVSSSIILIYLFEIIIAQNFFGITDNIIFNPATAVMYGVLPANPADFGELAGLAALTLSV